VIIHHETEPGELNTTTARYPRSTAQAFCDERFHSMYGPWHRETSIIAIIAFAVVVVGICGTVLFGVLKFLGAW
jgi:hypothetical protein